MKHHLLPALKLTFVLLLFLCILYPAAVWGIAQLAPNNGNGFIIGGADGRIYFENIGQSFTEDRYFWSRPSAVHYNAASTGGSNLGPSNPDYLATVVKRRDNFLAHHSGITARLIPSDLLTASGSGIDPHISHEAALVQVNRIARVRNLDTATVKQLVEKYLEHPLAGALGTNKVNLIKLNLALDQLK